jgi:DNA invertase Pin-like site-specific DNA recombinase
MASAMIDRAELWCREIAREELRTVLDFMRKRDVLMVTRIHRLSRCIGDLQDIVRTLKAKGASLKASEQPIDTSTATANASSACWACLLSSRQPSP